MNCETCIHYKECGTRLILSVMDNDIQCRCYEEKKKEKPKTQETEKKYRNLIICGFPGVGKSSAAEICKNILDLESTPFHFWDDGKSEDPNWFVRYVNEIEKSANDARYNYILVSTHKLVRSEMQYRGIPYIIVTPLAKLKDEYLSRYVKRGDCYDFIETLNINWEQWIEDFANDDVPIIHLDAGETMRKLLPVPTLYRLS